MDLLTALRLNPAPSRLEVVAFVGGGGKTSTLTRLAAEIAARGQRVVATTTTRMGALEAEAFPKLVEIYDESLPLDALARALDAHGQAVLTGARFADRAGEKRCGLQPEHVDELASYAEKLDLAAILVEADGSRGRPVKAPAAHEPVVPSCSTLLVPVVGMDAAGCRLAEPCVHRPETLRRILGLPAQGEERLTPRMLADLLVHVEGGAKLRPAGARLLPLLNKAEGAARLAAARVTAQLLEARGYPALIGSTGMPDRAPVAERWGAVGAVVLAAGGSRRLGHPKQLLTFDGTPLVIHAVRAALASDVRQVVVVVGAWADEVAAALAPLVARAGSRVSIVHNAAWETGQASSLHTGLQALAGQVEATLFQTVDQPWVSPGLLHRLMGLWRAGAVIAAPAVDGAPRGAPALFDCTLWPELLAIGGDMGGRPVLHAHRAEVRTIETAAELLHDVDTPEDIATYLSGAKMGPG